MGVWKQALSAVDVPIVLREHSADPSTAAAWLDACATLGIEGVVIKPAGGWYPTRPGCRVWYKLKRRQTRDLVVTGRG